MNGIVFETFLRIFYNHIPSLRNLFPTLLVAITPSKIVVKIALCTLSKKGYDYYSYVQSQYPKGYCFVPDCRFFG